MSDNKYRTYALTLRPKDGVTDTIVSSFSEWIRKRSTYYHMVTEMTGSSRHIHAACFFKKEISRSNLCNLISCFGKKHDFSNEELVVLRKGIRIMYSNDFIESYLSKDEDCEVICSELPESAHLQSWYPPKSVSPGSRKEQHSKYYWELESLWKETQSPHVEVHTLNARHFLFRMMYADRRIAIIRDDKTIVQTARHLVRFLNRAEYSTIELAPFEKEE